jgi:hypothetical protein
VTVAGFAGGFGAVVAGAVVAGAVVVPAGSVGSGAVSVETLSVTVRLPPVAVETAPASSPSPEIAIAAPVPSTAITRPSNEGTTQPAAHGWRWATRAEARSTGPELE